MPVPYKVILRKLPEKTTGGKKLYYAVPASSGDKTIEQLTRDIEKMSTVSGADIRAVIYALVDVMYNSLNRGEIVRIGELGSLRVSFSSEGKDIEELVTSNSIKKSRVIFTPGKMLKDMLATLEFKKVTPPKKDGKP